MRSTLTSDRYPILAPLFSGLQIHLVASAVLDGSTPAEVLVDDLNHPTSALVVAGHRLLLAGAADNASFQVGLAEWFRTVHLPRGRAAGEEAFGLYYDHPGWGAAIESVLGEQHLIKAAREYYVLDLTANFPPPPLPEGLTLQAVDAALLAQTQLANLDELKEEMCSERPSLEAFLAHSFGVCALAGSEIAGFCLSEYNSRGRCEVGIATRPAYQRRGLAAALTGALAAEAQRRGYHQVGWHCFTRNRPSGATARRAGFRKVCDYTCYLVWYDAGK